ncbi:hypothetical protein C8R47DRAFT_1322533 [Mycena vitilis]|nr:hypothetical protein C8R47DRAFT_1322533 [Mycena vitilis]
MDTAVKLISGTALLSSLLPDLEISPVRDGKGFYEAKHSSDKTEDEVAPAVLATIPSDELSEHIGEKELRKALERQRLAMEVEDSHCLVTEGDVERATHLYLIHSINLIMQEYVRKKYGKEVIICSSQVQVDDTRTDILWKVGEKTILVLEMKRCHVIVKEHWSPVIVQAAPVDVTDPAGKQAALLNLMTSKLSVLAITGDELTDNAPTLAKQAIKYSRTHNTPVVLLFDWQKLILLDLPAKAKKDNFTAQDPARIFFSEEGLGEGNVEWTHRKVLVAAFMMALKKLAALGSAVDRSRAIVLSGLQNRRKQGISDAHSSGKNDEGRKSKTHPEASATRAEAKPSAHTAPPIQSRSRLSSPPSPATPGPLPHKPIPIRPKC